MKKIVMILLTACAISACSNTNTANVPAAKDSNISAPPHDTASNLIDSAKHPDTSLNHKY